MVARQWSSTFALHSHHTMLMCVTVRTMCLIVSSVSVILSVARAAIHDMLHLMVHQDVIPFKSFCVEVGLVSRRHLLFGEVRSVTTALKVVEEVHGLQEIEGE